MRFRSPITLIGRLHFLDALRGLAAVAVMIFHFFAAGVSPVNADLAAHLPAWVGCVVGRMYCGVEIFFVLSGFVIAFSMDGYAADLRYPGNFILRRSLRLDPPYWVAAFLVAGCFFLLGAGHWRDYYLLYGGIKGMISNLFYLQNLPFVFPAHSILDVAWTLCLEVQFYLAYLVMLVAGYYAGVVTARHGDVVRRALVVAAVVGVGGWSFWHWVHYRTPDFAGRAWMFFLGVTIYRAFTRGIPPVAVMVALSGLAVFFVWRGDLESIVTVATAAAIFMAGVSGRLSTLLAYRPLLYLGKISYSIYLLHMLIGLNLLAWLGRGHGGSAFVLWTVVALAVVLSLGGAELFHRCVEAPSNRLSQRFKRRPGSLAAESG